MTTPVHRTTGIFVFAAMLAASAHAYGPDGHQTVGAIADRLLQGTPTETAVRQLLGTDLKTVSVWADCARSVKAGKFETNPRFPECDTFFTDRERLEKFVAANKAHTAFHFTDVSNLRRDYDVRHPGTATQDIVHAINAAIVVLRGQASPDPFSFADKREALMLLSHYIGDLHQPLHTVALYLDAAGNPMDPETVRDYKPFETYGGNSLKLGNGDLHGRWDAIPDRLKVQGADFEKLVADARFTPKSSGNVMTWSAQWATESIQLGPSAFEGLRFKPSVKVDGKTTWPVTVLDEAAYKAREDALKRQELVRAGARLAQLLRAVLEPREASCTASAPGSEGYIAHDKMPDVRAWVPAAPDSMSIAQLLDDKVHENTRALLSTPRGQSAAEDDVYAPKLVLDRFMPSAGAPDLSPAARARLETIIGKFESDASNLVEPMKKKVCAGGRVRPFVAKPGTATCLSPVDMAGHADQDLVTFGLAGSGSYPSTHSMIGMMTGLLLAELFPDRAEMVIARGLEFGQSRVVCGFHYQSDVDAGRVAAAGLLARVKSTAGFKSDLAEYLKEAGLSGPK